MNRRYTFTAILFIGLLSFFMPGIARAQGYTDYAFVIFDTAVTRDGVETSDANPQERRIYISNVVKFSERDSSVFRNAMKIADDYFIATIVEPMKAQGILHKYYDDAIKINNKVTYSLESRAEVEELQKKVLADLKEQNANIFTFTWTRDKNTKGLETSKPMLVQHGSEQPLYGVSEEKKVAPQNQQPSKSGKVN